MIDFTLNTKDFERQVLKAALWGSNDLKTLQKINRQVSKIYVGKVRGRISIAKQTIEIKRKETVTTVTPGQLRRSVGSWSVDPYSNRILAGPRVKRLGRRVSDENDGWFAHIVEQGALPDEFGGKRVNKNTGVFKRTMIDTQQKMKEEQRILYAARLKKYLK